MKSGHGSFSWKRIVSGSTISTCRTRAWSSVAPAPLYRSKLNFTSSVVTGSPLWNFRPRRSLNSYVSPSGLSVQDSAKLLAIFCPGSGLTRPSWRAWRTPKGVICGGAVDGSNHVGAMVTWNARTTSPAGWAAAPSMMTNGSARAHSMTTARGRSERESMSITCSWTRESAESRATSSGRPANGLQDGFDHSLDEEGQESEDAGEAPHREPASLKHQTCVEDRQDDDAHAQHDHDAFAGAH